MSPPDVPTATSPTAASPTATSPTVGFIGLGNIGAPMAQHLLDWPGGLVVCDLREEATAPFAEGGATVAADPAALGEQCSIVSVMVLDDAQVRHVTAELLSTMAPGGVIAIHSTIRPETAVEMERHAAHHEVMVLDAPVSGGFMGAHEGNLAVMLGGGDAAIAAVQEPFSRWAGLQLHMGPVGAGTKAKVARNLLHFIAFTAAGEAQRLAEAAGIPLRDLAKVVRHSDAITGGPGAIMLRDTAAPMPPDDPWRSTLDHVRNLGNKDLTLALELGSELGVDLPLGRIALDRLGTELGL